MSKSVWKPDEKNVNAIIPKHETWLLDAHPELVTDTPLEIFYRYIGDNSFEHLKEAEMHATSTDCTVQDGRLGTAVLPHRCDFNKSHRSKYVHACDGTVNIVRWSDNNVVTCISNFY